MQNKLVCFYFILITALILSVFSVDAMENLSEVQTKELQTAQAQLSSNYSRLEALYAELRNPQASQKEKNILNQQIFHVGQQNKAIQEYMTPLIGERATKRTVQLIRGKLIPKSTGQTAVYVYDPNPAGAPRLKRFDPLPHSKL